MRSPSKSKGRRRAGRSGERRFRATVDAAPFGMHFYRLEPDGRLVFLGANPAADRILGIENARFVGKTIEEAFPQLERTEVPQRYRAVARDGKPWFTEQVTYADDRIVGAFEVHAFQTAPGEMAAAFRDIAERRRAADELAREKQRLGATLRSIGDGVVATDQAARITLMNPVAEALTGWTASEAAGRRVGEIFRIFSDRTGEPTEDPVARVLRERAAVDLRSDVVLVARDGVRRSIACCGTPIMEGAEVRGVVLAFRDQSAEREAERRLLESEARRRAVVRSVPVLQWAADQEGVVTYSDGLALDTLGHLPEDLIGRRLGEIFPEAPGLHERFLRALGGEAFQAEIRLRGLTFENRMAPLRNEAGAIVGVAGVALDVTAQRRLQEQVERAQRLESIGRLAGGIAHDFNNVLTVVLSCAEELRRQSGERQPPVTDEVEEIREAGQRARDLVRQLLAFARKQQTAPEPTSLSEVVRGSEQMLRRLLGEDVQLLVSAEAELWPVLCDRGHVEQVLVNLAVNARDAMPEGGRLSISTRNLAAHDGAGDQVRLTVQDDGTGMPPEVKAHLFEPFFTTKPPGMGTGLGLATVYGLVTQNGGTIHAASEPGSGTTFEITFPRCARPAVPPRAATPIASVGGSETVLVVEDDPLVGTITVRALRGAGYEVLAARDGREALRIVEERGGPLHLVITDVVMPGMSGPALARQLAARAPDLRVLFVSGYSHKLVEERGVEENGPYFLAKPFTASALLERVRRLLDAPPGPVPYDGPPS